VKDAKAAQFHHLRSLQSLHPPRRLRVAAFDSTAPDLPTRAEIVIHQAHMHAALSRSSGGGHSGRARTHHQDLEFLARIATHWWSLPFPIRTGAGKCGNAILH
jgi:hypothetical protein